MKINSVDIDILAVLYRSDKALTTSTVAKRVYDQPDTSISKLDARVRHRLQKLADYKLVDMKEDSSGTSKYIANEDNVICSEAEIKTQPKFSNEEHEIVLDNLLFLYTEDVFYLAGYMPHNR